MVMIRRIFGLNLRLPEISAAIGNYSNEKTS